MPRLLAHLLLLLYAGLLLPCQPLPARAETTETGYSARPEPLCPGFCKIITLTRQELANLTGLRVETVIHTVKQLESDEKLTLRAGKIVL